MEPWGDVRFLRERGYSAESSIAAIQQHTSRILALRQLYNNNNNNNNDPSHPTIQQEEVPQEDIIQARLDEKEVLLAIFALEDDDDHDEDQQLNETAAVFRDKDDENSLDVVLPITTYEPPDRYQMPRPLKLEVYVDNHIAPLYPNEPPVLAVVGGGLAESQLKC